MLKGTYQLEYITQEGVRQLDIVKGEEIPLSVMRLNKQGVHNIKLTKIVRINNELQ